MTVSQLRTDSLCKNSLSEGTPRAPEFMASVQAVNITLDVGNALDAGSKDNLTFDMNDHGNLVQLAHEWSVNVADVALLKSVFKTYDVEKSGAIEWREFQKAVQDVLQRQGCKVDLTEDDLTITTENHWKAIVGDRGSLSFKEFVRWYCSYSFSEDLLLTSEEQWLRRLAKEQCVSPDYVSQMKVMFDSCDKDRSGDIGMEEFKQILCMTLKVPQHVGLPMSCVQYFWSQIDVDASGMVTFEEFLCWRMKYFDGRSDHNVKLMSYEDYYKNIRRIGPRFLDPPAYPPLRDIKDQ